MTTAALLSITFYFNQIYYMPRIPVVLADAMSEPKQLSVRDILNFGVIFAR